MEKFVFLDANLAELADDAKDPVFFKEKATGLIHFVEANTKGLDHEDAMAYCKGLAEKYPQLKDFDVDAPTIEEALRLIDYTQIDPAVDPALAPHFESSWYWTKSEVPGNSGCARVVYFSGGGSDWNYRGSGSCVRAVARPRQ